ncbi:MAG: hypothetical protein M1820_002787 [Bogoriella megaspora]|nr:MAG: hypothetical protein M1820_002787 [Bogoriella megaspora]
MPEPSQDLYRTEQAPLSTRPDKAARNNASDPDDKHVLDRFKIREICEGWPTYRDGADWENFRSMFHDDAYIATSWNQGPIDEFIEASKDAFAKQNEGMFYILHRVTGQTVDVQGNRAFSKMKVTITCRATIDGKEMDNEADCRFFFLLEKREGIWGVVFYTLLFDKDKMVPVNPTVGGFNVPENLVECYPSGYRYLCWLEARAGRPPKLDLNAHGPERDILYGKCKDWLEGKDSKMSRTLPGHPQVFTAEHQQFDVFLQDELLTKTLNSMAPHLWKMSIQSSANITHLHTHFIKGRHIIAAEDPCLHLVWHHDRISLKPLPKYLVSHDFWRLFLNPSTSPPNLSPSISKVALGLLCTYGYMIRHESHFTLAQHITPPLLPSDITWEQWCTFLRTFRTAIHDTDVSSPYASYGELRLTRLNFYIRFLLGKAQYAEAGHRQYATYFAQFYAPLLFVFGLASVALSTMQAELAVDILVGSSINRSTSSRNNSSRQNREVLRTWHGTWLLARWVSVVALGGAGGLAVCFYALFLFKYVSGWVFALKTRSGKRVPDDETFARMINDKINY